MPVVSWRMTSPTGQVRGFRYLWQKRVFGFNSGVHCAQCLRGSYEQRFGRDMPANEAISVDYPDGAILYFCGVATPYRWADNLHLAGRAVEGDQPEPIEIELHTGDTLTVTGLRRIAFDDAAAVRLFPNKGRKFLTCRNFQFAAQQFGGEAA